MSVIRVRFAPSPTGQLHFGGLRTALYNYLFARSTNGKFLLRIEDTDRERTVPGCKEHLQQLLEWTGLKPDEKPCIQSERVHLYQQCLNDLFQKKNSNEYIYPCYCPIERLKLLRHEAKRQNQPYRYDQKCRQLTTKQKDEYKRQGVPSVVRFILPPDESQVYDDLIFGQHEHNPYHTEGDFIIMKADGYPTYHFANVIDDHLMAITHVFRGHEWQTSTSKHLLLYKAFDWQPPKYGHLPLIEREKGRKLSKRAEENYQNPIEIEYYRKNDFIPDGLLNFITLTGGGFRTDTTIGKTLEEMIETFDHTLLTRHAAILDFKKLDVCQRAHLKRRYKQDRIGVIEKLRQKVMKYYPDKKRGTSLQLETSYLERILDLDEFRIATLENLFNNDLYEYLWTEPVLNISKDDDIEQLRFIIESSLKYKNIGTYETAKQIINDYKNLNSKDKLTNKEIFKVWRLTICGCIKGPPILDIVNFFGTDIVQKRCERALDALNKNEKLCESVTQQ